MYQPPRFGSSAAQVPDSPDTSPLLTPDKHHRLQQVPVLRAASFCNFPQDRNDDIQHSKHCK